ncbi:MAG: protein kinase, partial [Planctomycetes bacterium]|nr:protein kinase [Planctomycetota bacterium]
MLEDDDIAHRLEEAILECLESDDVESALASLRERYPDHVDQVTRVVARLRSLGALTAMGEGDEPRLLGPFQIRERLGEGGMGVVYRAWQDPPGREVALKVVRPELLHFDGTRARFDREIEAIVKLSHPGIVPVFEVGTSDGVPWFSMAFVRGCSLAAVIAKLGERGRQVETLQGADLQRLLADAVAERPPAGAAPAAGDSTSKLGLRGDWIESCLHVIHGVAMALSHAHVRGVMHRDIKPSNIMLSAGGHPLLLDFGLAHTEDSQRITHTQGVIGSLPYMPPEMLLGHLGRPTPALDVYSLGVTLYELLTLRNPFLGPTPEATRRRVIAARPELPRLLNGRIPKDLQTVCLTAMAADPDRRYATVADFAHDLDNVRNGAAIVASPDTALQRAGRFIRQNRLLVTATLAIIVLLAAGGATSLLMFFESERLRGISDATAYRTSVAIAEQSLRLHNVQHAIDALQASEPRLRAWEWRHLLARIDLSQGVALSRRGKMEMLSVGRDHIAVGCADVVVVLDRESFAPVREIPAVDLLDLAMVGRHVVWTDGRHLHATEAAGGEVRVFGPDSWSAIAADPDGEAVVTVSRGGAIKIWRLVDLSAVAGGRLQGVELSAVAVAADRLACASTDRRIYILDRGLKKVLATVKGHRGVIDRIAFDATGERLASVSRNRTVYLWAAESGELIGFPIQHEERVLALSFHPTRSEVFTAADQAIYRWSIRTGTRLGAIHGHRDRVLDLAWQTPQGPLLSVSEDGTLRRWDPRAEDVVRIQAHKNAILGLALLPDGSQVASLARGEAGRVWSTTTRETVFDSIDGRLHRGRGVFVDRGGRSLAWLTDDTVVRQELADWSDRWTAAAGADGFRAAA